MSFLDKWLPSVALKRAESKLRLRTINALLGTNSGTGYGNNGASIVKDSLAGWRALSGDADSDIVYNLDILRNRSRDLYMGAPLANGAIKTIVTNVVGGGLTLNAKIDNEFLGLSRDEAIGIEKQIEREFKLWSEKSYCCDSAASQNFDELQKIVMTSILLSGDVFVLLPVLKRNNSIYDLKIKLLEADRVCDPLVKDMSKSILGGVEVNSDTGMPEYYYIVNQMPYMINYAKLMPLEWAKVPVFGSKSGRRNILHLFTAERPGQRRGAPILAPVIDMFKQLARYSDAEITAAVISGMFSVFIKKENSAAAPMSEADIHREDDSMPNYRLAPGMMVGLKPNESIEIANPGRPNTAFDGFVQSVLKQIGVALEIPYEILVKKFDSSYSASRAAILTAWEVFLGRRKWLVNNFCRPVYEEWLAEAVAKGRISMPGFFDDIAIRAAWSKADFFGSSVIQVDPVKEAEAAETRVKNGFSTRAKEAAELSGLNFDEIAQTRAIDEKLVDDFRREQKPTYIGVINSNNALKGSGNSPEENDN